MSNKFIFLLIFSFLFYLPTHAEDLEEEWDEDEDLELFFSTRQKSTLEDFPLQEIASDELSNAAIAGALRANTSSGLRAKPVYEKEKEETDKKKAGDALKEDEMLKLGDSVPLNQFPLSVPEFQQPIYSQPTGRTYIDHSTSTTSRP